VINQFNGLRMKNNKSYFLAGMADMELKNQAAAVPLFEQIIANNRQSGENYFQDEAEYYLAMAYLGSNAPAKAIVLLRKIKGDKDHLYNRVVNEMSWLDLNIVEYKNGK
jgi:tetratricopeptide (TPR) repeat protein